MFQLMCAPYTAIVKACFQIISGEIYSRGKKAGLRHCAKENFEPSKNCFKYFHDSFYFDSIQQADEFLDEVNQIDEKYLRNESREFLAQKHDVLIQTCGIKRSVHFVYPFFSLKKLKSEESSVDYRQELAMNELNLINANTKDPLDHAHFIRLRLTNRARADTYLVVNYEWYYQYFKKLDPLKYLINDVERDQTVTLKNEAPSSEKISKSVMNQSVIDEEKEIDIVDGELTHSKITGSNQPVFKQSSDLIEELLHREINLIWIIVEGLYDKSLPKARIFFIQHQFW